MKQNGVLKAAAAALFLILPSSYAAAQDICGAQPLYCMIVLLDPPNERVCVGELTATINRDFREGGGEFPSGKELQDAVRQACSDYFDS